MPEPAAAEREPAGAQPATAGVGDLAGVERGSGAETHPRVFTAVAKAETRDQPWCGGGVPRARRQRRVRRVRPRARVRRRLDRDAAGSGMARVDAGRRVQPAVRRGVDAKAAHEPVGDRNRAPAGRGVVLGDQRHGAVAARVHAARRDDGDVAGRARFWLSNEMTSPGSGRDAGHAVVLDDRERRRRRPACRRARRSRRSRRVRRHAVDLRHEAEGELASSPTPARPHRRGSTATGGAWSSPGRGPQTGMPRYDAPSWYAPAPTQPSAAACGFHQPASQSPLHQPGAPKVTRGRDRAAFDRLGLSPATFTALTR